MSSIRNPQNNPPTYTKLVDDVGSLGTTLYIGESEVGSGTGEESWRIQKIVFTGDLIIINWASGTASFDKVWNNRATYTYI